MLNYLDKIIKWWFKYDYQLIYFSFIKIKLVIND